MPERIELNGRHYRKPTRPSVVICLDGCDPEYIRHGIANTTLPAIASFRHDGYFGEADAAMPTFTNPNNVSIVTGVPPVIHGIGGNFYLERTTGREVMITDASLLRCETILAVMSRAGVKTSVITAKDKLRKLLGQNVAGICFSAEHADQCTDAENGITGVEALVGRPTPQVYSADLSLFVLDAGIRLLERGNTELAYLSLSDYVQHTYAPGEPEADAFHQAIDDRVRRLMQLGAVVGLVADHGMNDKALPNGEAHVIFLEDELNARFGADSARVICPITDPYVRHHGALGSFVRVYGRSGIDLQRLMQASAALPGVAQVIAGPTAARTFELPADLEGDFVVLGDHNTVIGSTRLAHDLSGLVGHRLRSHGGLAEQRVPFMLSRPLTPEYQRIAQAKRLRNFDIFDFLLNGTE